MRARLVVLLVLVALTATAADAWPPWGRRTGPNPVGPWHGPGTVVASVPTFDLYPTTSGPSQLSDTLATTGATIVASCDAGDVSGTDWACDTGGTFTATGGTPTSGVAAPFIESAARAVRIQASALFSAPSTSTADPGTADLVIEWIGTPRSSSRTIIGKSSVTGSGLCTGLASAGWCMYGSSPSTIVKFHDGVDTATAGQTNTGTDWNHIIVFFDRDSATGLQMCINGTCGSAVDGTAVGDLANASKLVFDGNTSDTYMTTYRQWSCSGCLNTANFATIAAERFAAASGLIVTASGTATPTTKTRATTAYVDIDRDEDGVRTLHLVGKNWIRTAKRKDTGSTYHTGLLIEPAATNLALQSQTLANASWTEANIDAVSEGTTATPDGSSTGDSMESTDGAGSVEHYHRQAITVTAAAYTFSAFVKAGADAGATHAFLRDATVANATGWIKLSDCSAGTTGAGLSALHAESWGNGWCRIGVTFTGTAASHNFDIGYSAADNATSYDDGTDSDSDLVAWGAQVELGTLPTSYIPTTTASATRNADDLRYSGTSNASNGPGTMEVIHISTNHDTPSTSEYLAHIGTSGTTNNRRSAVHGATERYEWTVNTGATGSAAITGTATDQSDGDSHTFRGTWATDDFVMYTDGASDGTPDVSGAIPAATDTIFVGEAFNATAQLNGIIERVRIWDEVVAP